MTFKFLDLVVEQFWHVVFNFVLYKTLGQQRWHFYCLHHFVTNSFR